MMMAATDVAVIAGSVSTVVFVASYLPMLLKAVRSKDLSSYSATNLILANAGNVVHSVYVFSLPAGPLWVLHTFYLVGSSLMLFWWSRYRRRAVRRRSGAVVPAHRDTGDEPATDEDPGRLTPAMSDAAAAGPERC
jgi:uncharacterized protein with PQ loop repeat